MANLKQQIFQELNALEDAAAGLRGTAVAAGKQTDLEVAILTEQVVPCAIKTPVPFK